MGRRWLIFLSGLAFLGAVLATLLPAAGFLRQWTQRQQVLEEMDRKVAQLSDREQASQRNLAKWYNRNLGSLDGEEAYGSILNLSGGCMGYLEVAGQQLPIFHGQGSPVGHDPATALPIGGKGNHTVLWLEDGMELKKGDLVIIGCLGERLNYRVESVQVMAAGWTAERPQDPGADLLTLVYDRGRTRTIVRCCRTGELTVKREPEQENPLLWAILGVLTPVGFGAFQTMHRGFMGNFQEFSGEKPGKSKFS